MAYRVEVAERAFRDLRRIYVTIQAAGQKQARDWFDGLENTIFSLAEYPSRGAVIAEDASFRHLLYGRKRHRYRIIYAIDEGNGIVTVYHIRHGSRAPFNPDDPDGDSAP